METTKSSTETRAIMNVTNTIVVIVFVTFMMALVSVLDFVFTKFVLWVFGG